MARIDETEVSLDESDLVLLEERLIAHISWQQDYAFRSRLLGKVLTLIESVLPSGQQCEAAKMMAKQVLNGLCDDLCDEVTAHIASLAKYQDDKRFAQHMNKNIEPYDFVGTESGWR